MLRTRCELPGGEHCKMRRCASRRTPLSFIYAGVAACVVALGAAAEPEGLLMREMLFEETSARLSQAIEQDDSETVLQLLPDPDAPATIEALVVAASLDSHEVVEALLESSVGASAPTRYPLEKVWVVPFDGYTALHAAAERESVASARLLLEYGADVNARAEGGWTPLHLALFLAPDERPDLAIANLLLARGADPTAATDLVGWTPLHLAALQAPSLADEVLAGDAGCCGDEGAAALALVGAMLAQGADARTRTRFGDWTPLQLAMNRLRFEAKGRSEGLAERDPVLRALRAASPLAPLTTYTAGQGDTWNGVAPFGSSAGHRNIAYALASGYVFGAGTQQGSFTSADAEERILFEHFELAGDSSISGGRHEAVALEDQHGVVRPIMVYDDYTDFKGICRDPQTNTDVLMFQHSYEVPSSEDRVYLQYSEAKGAFTTVVREVAVLYEEALDPSLMVVNAQGVCDWRASASVQVAYETAIAALGVGEASDLQAGTTQSLPTRMVPAAAVAMQLEKLRELPKDVVEVWEVEGESRWKVVGVEYKRLYSQPRVQQASDAKGEFRIPCEGALLAWDGSRQEWRSLLDCAALDAVLIHGKTQAIAMGEGVGEVFLLDVQAETTARRAPSSYPYYWKVHEGTLSATAYSRDWSDCPSRSEGRACYLEIDLPTGAARLQGQPMGNYWIEGFPNVVGA